MKGRLGRARDALNDARRVDWPKGVGVLPVLPRRLLWACALLHLACSGEELNAGLTEPLRASLGGNRNAQFQEGELPGTPAASVVEGAPSGTSDAPTVSLNVGGSVIRESDTGFLVNGSTSSEAVAVGLRFSNLGTGYWVLPVTGQDPTRPGTFTWSASLDFGADVSAGFQTLAAVAIDGAGHGGRQATADLCVASDIPDNLSACSPSQKPPRAVVSLAWDAPVDLDLRVITPQGKTVDPKHPSTANAVDGRVDPTASGTGVFDIDAERDCVATGHRRENLVWQDAPAPGRYLVYASLFAACGQPAVRFTLSLNQSAPNPDDKGERLQSSFQRSGELLAIDADAGARLGLFITEFIVQ